MDEPTSKWTLSRFQRLKNAVTGARFMLYCSYFLSAWGNRTWAFALSVALSFVSGDAQYTAASGLVNGITVLVFGSVVGKWVDRTDRLRAVRISLIANNLTLALSAGILLMIVFLSKEIKPIWNGWLLTVFIWLSILLCACSILADVATKIMVTKDWVVVICESNEEKLAETNSMMVRIDTAPYALSPMFASQLMSSFGTGWGCAFVAFWNIGSCVVEYCLLRAVYKSCPDLTVKGVEKNEGTPGDISAGSSTAATEPTIAEKLPCFTAIARGLRSFYEGYRTYFRQPVMPAGLALACLYLTVLAFDGVTIVFLDLPQNLTVLCQALGAVMGVVGSLIYPRLLRRSGLHRTGLISLAINWACLLLPVASIWLPGSKFGHGRAFGKKTQTDLNNCTGYNETNDMIVGGIRALSDSDIHCDHYSAAAFLKTSLSVFLVGVTLSRMGTWMADLSIAQVFQEGVPEQERGVVNGVQDGMNNMMDMAKSILVIILPNPHTFGILIIITWMAVFIGFLCFCYYSRREIVQCLPLNRRRRIFVPKT